MTVTDAPVDRLALLEAKIDVLTERLGVLTADAEARARQRAMLDDLTGDLGRVSEEAMAAATRRLEALDGSVDLAATARLLERLLEVAPVLDRLLAALAQGAELVDDAAPLGTEVLTTVTDRLAEAERKGYFDFARAGAGVVDRVVTNFSEDDVEQLGTNVVTILETVREITQPEMLALLGRMVAAVNAEQAAVELEDEEPPSLWALARQVRDPEVRRGMARALHTLRAVSAETGPSTAPNHPEQGSTP